MTYATSVATPSGHPLRQPWPWAVLLVWGAAIMALAGSGMLRPEGISLPFPLAIAALIPPAIFALAYRLSPGLRSWVAAIDMSLIVGAQTWRVMGVVFLFVWAMGDLPTIFALAAGIGDMAVGLAALGVTLAVARGAVDQDAKVRRLTVFGLMDFVLAFGTAILSGEGMPLRLAGEPLPALMQSLPMAMIPAFLVPVFIILHLMAWFKLR
ncbi:hypothetical protein [Tabrizicola sp.]|uniref:hypothetical protein n=1 Tax=Tabrizicola sp. TaxID=2005166 RepID=UPI003F38E8B8